MPLQQGGSAASNSGSVSTLALPSFNLTASWDVLVAIALGSTSSSVSSITDTKGNTYTLQAAVNGSGIRTELWAAHNVGAQTANIITVNLASATSVAVAAEAYSGVNAEGGTATSSGATINMQADVATVEGNDWTVSAFGFSCQSGDTLTAIFGTSRQSSIPAATAVGVALYDNAMGADCTAMTMSRISSARNWASVALDLESGNAAIVPSDVLGTIVAAQPSSATLKQDCLDYGGALVPNLSGTGIVEELLEPLFANEQPNNYGFVF